MNFCHADVGRGRPRGHLNDGASGLLSFIDLCHADAGSIRTIAREASGLLGFWRKGIDSSYVGTTKFASMTRLSFGTTKNHNQSDRKSNPVRAAHGARKKRPSSENGKKKVGERLGAGKCDQWLVRNQ